MYKSFFSFVCCFLLLCGCSNAQTSHQASQIKATTLASTLKNEQNIQLLDVRTPAEFSNGHVAGAVNANINSKEFQTKITALDKSKPVYVYCLSGGRSSNAVKQLLASGFEKVVEMPGGIMEWRAANLPEVKNTVTSNAKTISLSQYQALVKSDKLVLVDFYADWCAPCKEMKPYLDKISNDMANKVVVVRIDADANPELCKTLKINALPVLKLYKNEQLIWENLGFIEEAAVRKKLK
ncbi:thioredoxin domain-containing protein [Nubsella zeaxanthinifaciens]|jgi:thioredoxin 1|uniref:thioredoxin domain-containing protein n=1 Tax=Nubsella zeaxanthinifaciens TaxID=392412 RepID=UPI000DE1CDDE|nr:thioredoxin domain-containing protein [Nubsella zeaxanthinifaciens]